MIPVKLYCEFRKEFLLFSTMKKGGVLSVTMFLKYSLLKA